MRLMTAIPSDGVSPLLISGEIHTHLRCTRRIAGRVALNQEVSRAQLGQIRCE